VFLIWLFGMLGSYFSTPKSGTLQDCGTRHAVFFFHPCGIISLLRVNLGSGSPISDLSSGCLCAVLSLCYSFTSARIRRHFRPFAICCAGGFVNSLYVLHFHVSVFFRSCPGSSARLAANPQHTFSLPRPVALQVAFCLVCLNSYRGKTGVWHEMG